MLNRGKILSRAYSQDELDHAPEEAAKELLRLDRSALRVEILMAEAEVLLEFGTVEALTVAKKLKEEVSLLLPALGKANDAYRKKWGFAPGNCQC